MSDILQQIIDAKKEAIRGRKKLVPQKQLIDALWKQEKRRPLRRALAEPDGVHIIAEIKKASPSAGLIAPTFDPAAIARKYTEAGATAISVLTEEKFFKGDLNYLALVREATGLPLLRKDFIVDPYQVYESLVYGADAILLIAAALGQGELVELMKLARKLGLDCLLEVHTEEELERALSTDADLIGINSRDLKDFSVSLERTESLAAKVRGERTVVIESGIKSGADTRRFVTNGIMNFLVGETLMRSASLEDTMRELKEPVNG